MTDKNDIEKIAESIFCYKDFLKKFKEIKEEYTIEVNQNGKEIPYAFSQYNVDSYIIDKKYMDAFTSKIDFNDLIEIITVMNDENKKKFKEELKKKLDKNPYTPNGERIKLYSKEEEMKEIVQNLNDYTFINKEILCNVMRVPESKLDNNNVRISKNRKNIYFSCNNCIISFERDNFIKNKEVQKYKNLYYVEEITKKIFVLLYFNEQRIKNKLQKKIKDVYNFKNYYLINSDWLNEYKEFFQYETIKKKLIKQMNLKNEKYLYKKIKYNLNEIVKNIGQISLYSETEIDNYLRKGKNLIPQKKKINLEKENENEGEFIGETIEPEEKEVIFIPYGFEIITDDIYELLLQEKFFFNLNDKVKNEIKCKLLIGNNQIILKNVFVDNTRDILNDFNNYCFYIDKNKKLNSFGENDWDKDDTFIIYYTLN